MASKTLFGGSTRGRRTPEATTKNEAGGLAYEFTPEHALAQAAFTGTFNDSYYVSGTDQLARIRQVADKCDPLFIAQCAVAAREKGYMKDMPAALCAMLSKADPVLLRKAFPRAVDNGRQLRNFVQMMRSGAFGRKSLGTGPKKLVQKWLTGKSDYALFRASVGKDPSLADILKMVHPKPLTPQRRALYAYLIGKDYDFDTLPEIVQQFELWKKGEGKGEVPNVDFRQLTALPLTKEQWASIAKNGRWHQTRMNLNTYTRQGVFEIAGMEKLIADKLVDKETIAKSKVFPYQLMAAYVNTGPARRRGFGYFGYAPTSEKPEVEVPKRVRLALQDALEIAVDNVPAYEGKVAVIVDTSGSMQCPVTGHRKGATTKVMCVDVAALVAATVMRKNPLAVVVPVDTKVHSTDMLNPRDSIMTNADKLAKLGGGGTDLGAAMQFVSTAKVAPDLIIMVSDNESWVGDQNRYSWRGTCTQEIFNQLQARNPAIKMVCIDIQNNTSSQTVQGNPSIMNIGGFSDEVFNTIDRFVRGVGPSEWVEEIKAIDLDEVKAQA